MVQAFQDLQALGDDAVRFVALDMGNEANAAGIVFKLAVEAVRARGADFVRAGRDHAGLSARDQKTNFQQL